MYSVIRKFGINFILDCPSKVCPVKHPEICPINFPMPCPNIRHSEQKILENMKNEKNTQENANEKENDKLLGRWKPEIDFKKTAIKVDYANVDHCGPCGSDDVRNMTNVYRKPPNLS
jgi:hypothetical protein